jgi:signal transduction histidine kinase
MRQQRRDLLAAAIAIVALTLGIAAVVMGRIDPGIDLQVDGDHLVVARVTPYSPATMDQVQVGMIVTELNGTQVYRLPAYVYPDTPTDDPSVAPEPIGIEPPEPVGALTPDEVARMTALADAPVQYMNAIAPNDLAAGQPDAYAVRTFWYYGPGWQDGVLPLLVGSVLLFAGWKLVRDGTFGVSLQPLAAPIAVAVATPFLTRPLAATWDTAAAIAAGLLTTIAMLPLADGLWERIRGASERRSIGLAIAFCEILAIFVTFAIAQQAPSWTTELTRWALIGAIPLLPGLAAAGPLDFEALRSPSASSGRLLESAEFAVAGATPLFAIASLQTPAYSLLYVWIGFVIVAGRFTVRPLARLASRAQMQRDLVVAATEAERARLAADIHDDALQELTLLVRRLEASGDEEGAELGRTVAERLRAICGDLRLPILDDLGVGPALDWLVLRIERLAGGEVRLERVDGTRPPAEVELAFFRVAQEALANAVKHGQPPIVVRYRSTDSGASLTVDDAGPGIEPDAGAVAERGGHFGLMNMQQRAEAIGAILDVRRWPGGGTHVALEWRAQ